MLGERIANLRKKHKLSQYDLADRLGFSRGKLANYEQGSRQPDYETLKKIADYFEVSVDYLLYGKKEQVDLKELNEKDEKDIAKRMEQIRKDLTSEDGLLFNGEPMSEEAVESFLEAMEYAVRQTQRINKKYIPKKFREKENKD
jgi:transcriptional regulator with XRE-family HTH domain